MKEEKEKLECPPEHREKLDSFRKELPERIRFLEDQQRLIDLARQSPYAAASRDFLELQQNKLEKQKGETELAKIITEIMK